MAFGTLRKLQLDGYPFDVDAEADLTQNVQYETSMLPTSGKNYPKAVKKVALVDGVVIICDGTDWKELQAFAARAATESAYPINYTDGDGNSYSGPGQINIESRTTQEGKATISLLPETVFNAFLA